MTFLEGGGFGGGGTSNPFGGGGIAGGNPGPPSSLLGGGFGSSGNKLTGQGPGPGFVSPFDQQAVGQAANLSSEAMANRYAQLGLSSVGATPTSPGGPAGGIGVGNIGGGMLPGSPGTPGSGEPTAEAMDLGQIPTLTGGIPGEAMAAIGDIQNANLQSSSGGGGGGGGKGGGGKGGLGSIGSLAMMGAK